MKSINNTEGNVVSTWAYKHRTAPLLLPLDGTIPQQLKVVAVIHFFTWQIHIFQCYGFVEIVKEVRFIIFCVCACEVGCVCVPAAVSLAAASVNTLGQSVVQTGINHIQTDGLLVHLTTGISVKHKHNTTHWGGGVKLWFYCITDDDVQRQPKQHFDSSWTYTNQLRQKLCINTAILHTQPDRKPWRLQIIQDQSDTLWKADDVWIGEGQRDIF